MNLPEQDLFAYLLGEDDNTLFYLADTVRGALHGHQVRTLAVVEFSNHCDKCCPYCGLRAPNLKAVRYRLTPEEVVRAAIRAGDHGAGAVVLQSADDRSYSTALLGGIILEIKGRRNLEVILAVGDRGLDEYEFWRDCGADGVLLRIETSDPGRYARLRDNESFTDRLHRLQALRAMDFEVGTGVVAGLPGTTPLDALRDVLLLADLDPALIVVGPFVPNPDTPMGNQPAGDPLLSLRMTGLLRLLCPLAHIPACSSLDGLLPQGMEQGLARGCNALMPAATPAAHRRDYALYPGDRLKNMDENDTLDRALEAIRRAGFVPTAA